MITIIGFIGKAGSGKTTAAKVLQDSGYIRLSIAYYLKRMLIQGLGINKEYIDGSKKSEPCDELCGTTARHAMITLGTEWGRELIHPDIWVKATERQLKHMVAMGERRFVIDDIRFVNESIWVQSLGHGYCTSIVKIIRDTKEIINHQSETEQEYIMPEFTIQNDSTLEILKQNVVMVENMIHGNYVKVKE